MNDLETKYNRIQELSKKLHWIKMAEDGVAELYLDNHMLQTFRACESRFNEEMINGYNAKNSHLWFLDFGICIHTMIEYYYVHRKDPDFNIIDWAGYKANDVWTKMKMEEYFSKGSQWHHKGYDILGGYFGFANLLLQYAQHFHMENERFRIIGAELYFGKNKEVPIMTTAEYLSINKIGSFPFRLYLSGKIDLLIDDGYNIGPMDHKSSSDFMGRNPIINYEVHDGMTGYVYAAREILKQISSNSNDEGLRLRSNVNKMWMNFLQVKPETDPPKRFKRIPLFITDYQLEQYRLRQIRTASKILDLLLNENSVPDRNTMLCTNYMHHICSFHEVHRQNSKESELVQLKSSFNQGKIWNPENRDNDNLID